MSKRQSARFEDGPAAGEVLDLPPADDGEWPSTLDPADVIGILSDLATPPGTYELQPSPTGEGDLVYRFRPA